jgi:hypothetical protein
VCKLYISIESVARYVSVALVSVSVITTGVNRSSDFGRGEENIDFG